MLHGDAIISIWADEGVSEQMSARKTPMIYYYAVRNT